MEFFKNLSQNQKMLLGGTLIVIVFVAGVYFLTRGEAEQNKENINDIEPKEEAEQQMNELEELRREARKSSTNEMSDEEKIEKQENDLDRLRGQSQ